MGCKRAGATTIIGVDINPGKKEIGKPLLYLPLIFRHLNFYRMICNICPDIKHFGRRILIISFPCSENMFWVPLRPVFNLEGANDPFFHQMAPW